MEISFTDVTLEIGQKTILKNINISLTEQRIAVIGANGSGKSSFLRLINGLYLPSSGAVTIDKLDSKRDGKAIRQKVGFVFQNPDNQIVMPLVAEDLEFGLKNLNIAKEERQKRVDDFLTTYGFSHLRDCQAHAMSGGQKQMLAFGAVLIMQPRLIICDEPTTQLDYKNARRIKYLLDNLPQQLIVSSHDLNLIDNFERILVFNEGEIIFDGPFAKACDCYLSLMEGELAQEKREFSASGNEAAHAAALEGAYYG